MPKSSLYRFLTVTLIICGSILPSKQLIGAERLYDDPPFWGTIFIDGNIVTSEDPTSFQSLTYKGQGSRLMYDRRVTNWITVNAFLFEAVFEDDYIVEVQVNPEFQTSSAAQEAAIKFMKPIGQLGKALRRDLETVWIHNGVEAFGGGNNNLLIYTGQAELYEDDDILEEVLIHEAAHTSLDGDHARSEGWIAAQNADAKFISNYARDNPTREDVAESFLPYIAIRYFPDRISESLKNTILSTIPNRIAYFDAQSMDLSPLPSPTDISDSRLGDQLPGKIALHQNYPNPFNPETIVQYELSEALEVSLSVFDVMGRTVAQFNQGLQAPGNYEVRFDGKNLSSGVYFYKLSAGVFTQTRQMMLIK